METFGFVCVVLLLHPALCLGHKNYRINSLETKLKNKLRSLRSDLENTRNEFRDEIIDTEEKIKSDLKSDLPEVIRTILFELLYSGEIGSIPISQNEVTSLKRNVNQLKRKVEMSGEEQLKQKEELKKIRSELEKVVEENYLLKVQLTERTCQCREEFQSNITVMTSSNSDVTTTTPTTQAVTERIEKFQNLLAVGFIDGQFYQFDFENYTREEFPLVSSHIDDVVFDGMSRSIVWVNRSSQALNESGIYSMNIANGNVTPLLTGVVPNGLALDSDFIYFGTAKPNFTISKISRTMEDSITIADVSNYGYVYCLTLDPTRRLIFSCHWDRILQMDYEGRNSRLITRGSGIYNAVLDPPTLALYYSDMDKIMKLLLKGKGKAEQLFVLSDFIHRMVFDSGILYTGDMRNGQIRASSEKTNTTIVIGAVESSLISLCLLP